jgi:uncharacterized protein YecE (DUF72 family)
MTRRRFVRGEKVNVVAAPRDRGPDDTKPRLASARLVATAARPRGALFLGTSGFSYDEWKGAFYPASVKAKDRLAFYATRFTSTEINYTFRRTPSEKTLAAWRAATPDGFVFAVKAHMRITHVLRLVDAGDAAVRFLDALAPLGPRLGPILFQCPPNLAFDATRLSAFLAALPTGRRYVFEFRHASWDAAKPLLAARGAAWCVAETDDDPAPSDALSSGPFHYLRLRKTTYAPAALRRWAERVAAALVESRDVHCYFKHEDEAKGPKYATSLAKMVATLL